ncbi:MAG: TolC family protein [Bacteroidales bacterium]|nr:TolC family protein [Bacteroidales bacterium]
MKHRIALLFLLLPVMVTAQDTLFFRECLELVIENAPRLRDKQIIDEQGHLIQDNIRASWYPTLELNGKASYQSDVVSFEIDQPGIMIDFPEMPNEQYGINLDIRQTIYDGGLSGYRKAYELAATESSMKKAEIDLHSLKGSTTELYFSVLLLEENTNNLEIALENLKSREEILISAIENGIARETDLNVIRVEILKILQLISELDAARHGTLDVLSVYIGRVLNERTVFISPYIECYSTNDINRPELDLFNLQSEMLDIGKKISRVNRMPKLFAFGQAGIGMPGYNMLNDQLDTYYMVGAGLNWNIWDWNKTNREEQLLEKRKMIIENSKETFLMHTDAAMKKEYRKMDYLESALDLDQKMLQLRKEITRVTSTELDQGVISATDFLQVLNEEVSTRVARATHKLKLRQSIANYNLLNGTL